MKMRKQTYFLIFETFETFTRLFLQDKLLQFVQNGGDAEFFQFFNFICFYFLYCSATALTDAMSESVPFLSALTSSKRFLLIWIEKDKISSVLGRRLGLVWVIEVIKPILCHEHIKTLLTKNFETLFKISSSLFYVKINFKEKQ